MYFNVNGKLDVSQMLSSENGSIDKIKFCNQIIENDTSIDGFITCAEIEKWKMYYCDMHPQMRLCEDILQKGITDTDIKSVFAKFFKPLDAENCSVIIVDPYLFANRTNSNLLSEILIDNVKSKSIKFYTDYSKDDSIIKNQVINKLQQEGFVIQMIDCNDSHDRYWFTRKNGFMVGTSFNGLGNKISSFLMLSAKDLNDVISIFGI